MPTYEYQCKSCNHGFEVFHAMSDQPVKDCPKCGKEVRRLIFGGAGIIFKGQGFYVTDKSSASKKGSKVSGEKTAHAAGTGAQTCGSCPAAATKECPAVSAGTETKTA